MKYKLVKRGGDKDICNRYRPSRFSEVVGNAALLESLSKTMENPGRHRNYLFYGSSGTGKTTVARIMAMGLNCEKGNTVEPCLDCLNCKAALAGNALHIFEMNCAQLNKKEDAENLVAQFYMTAVSGRNTVFILDEVQMLTEPAQNLLLKPVEDSSESRYLFFCTTDKDKIIPPLLNRLEPHRFRPPSEVELQDAFLDVYTQEGYSASHPALEDIVQYVERKQNASLREFIRDIDLYARGGLDVIDMPDGMVASEKTIEVLADAIHGGNVIDALAKLQSINMDDYSSESIRLGLRNYFTKRILASKVAAVARSYAAIAEAFSAPCEKGSGIKPELATAVCKACEAAEAFANKAKK